MPEDIKSDIYRLMDKSKLTGGNFLQGKIGMTTLVHRAREQLAAELTDYVIERERKAVEKFKQENV